MTTTRSWGCRGGVTNTQGVGSDAGAVETSGNGAGAATGSVDAGWDTPEILCPRCPDQVLTVRR